MSINKQFVHFNLREDFDKELAAGNILDTSIVFIKDTQELYTHGQLYQGSKPDWNSEETNPGFIQNKPLVDYTTPEIYMDVSVQKHKGESVSCNGNISTFPVDGHTYRITINGKTEIRKALKYTVPEGQSPLSAEGFYFPRITPDKVDWSSIAESSITDPALQNAYSTLMIGGLCIVVPEEESTEGYTWAYNPKSINIGEGEASKLTEDTLYTIKMEDLNSTTSTKKFDSKYCYTPNWEALSSDPTYIQNKPFGNLYDYETVVDGQMYLMDVVYVTETTMVIAWISYPKAPLLSDIFYKVTVDGNLGGQCLSHEYSYTVEGVTYKGVAIAETYKLIDSDNPSGHYPDSNWGFATLEIEGMLVGVWLQRYKKPAEETASILSLDESSTEEPALEDLFIKALGDNPSQLVLKLYNTNSDSVSNSDEGIALLSDSPLPGEGYDIPTTEEEIANLEVRTIKVESLEKVNSIKKLDEKWLDTTWKKGSGSESVKTNSNLAVGESTVAHGSETYASGPNSHSEGFKSSAWGFASHAEGWTTGAAGYSAHSEGRETNAKGGYDHAEGWGTTANANASHAEGHNTNTTGSYSHVEGEFTETSGYASHAEGYYSKAKGEYTHAEGAGTVPWGKFSHAEGSDTYTNNYAEHASGMYNTSSGNQGKIDVFDGSADATLASVGNGTSETRHNAVEIRQSGEIFIQETADRNAELTKPLVSVQNKIQMLNNIQNDLYEYNTNGHEYVDLGLPSGNLWATCNLGATTPTEVGKFFQWGDTQGYTQDEIGTAEGKKPFSNTWSDYKFSKEATNTDDPKLTKYCSNIYKSYNRNFVDYISKLELIDDAANVLLRGDWRVPTEQDFRELVSNTTVSYTTDYNNTGISACVFTSRINGATLVLPYPSNNGTTGSSNWNPKSYWTSTLAANGLTVPYINVTTSGVSFGTSGRNRYFGFQIRPIISGPISGGGNKKYYSREEIDQIIAKAPVKAFAEVWKTLDGCGFDETNQLFTTTIMFGGKDIGLKDITYAEAVDAWVRHYGWDLDNYAYNAKRLTVYPLTKATFSGYSSGQTCVYNTTIEQLQLVKHMDDTVSGYVSIGKCQKLKTIVGRLRETNGYTLEQLPELENVCIYCPSGNNTSTKTISIPNSPKLSVTSVYFSVSSSTGNVKIIVHPDVYAKLTGDYTNEAAAALTDSEKEEWIAIASLASESGITLASA